MMGMRINRPLAEHKWFLPALGLGRASELVPAKAGLQSAAERHRTGT
mgnify:CR=1 FL=1